MNANPVISQVSHPLAPGQRSFSVRDLFRYIMKLHLLLETAS